jgi:hypothetical protein
MPQDDPTWEYLKWAQGARAYWVNRAENGSDSEMELAQRMVGELDRLIAGLQRYVDRISRFGASKGGQH